MVSIRLGYQRICSPTHKTTELAAAAATTATSDNYLMAANSLILFPSTDKVYDLSPGI